MNTDQLELIVKQSEKNACSGMSSSTYKLNIICLLRQAINECNMIIDSLHILYSPGILFSTQVLKMTGNMIKIRVNVHPTLNFFNVHKIT